MQPGDCITSGWQRGRARSGRGEGVASAHGRAPTGSGVRSSACRHRRGLVRRRPDLATAAGRRTRRHACGDGEAPWAARLRVAAGHRGRQPGQRGRADDHSSLRDPLRRAPWAGRWSSVGRCSCQFRGSRHMIGVRFVRCMTGRPRVGSGLSAPPPPRSPGPPQTDTPTPAPPGSKDPDARRPRHRPPALETQAVRPQLRGGQCPDEIGVAPPPAGGGIHARAADRRQSSR